MPRKAWVTPFVCLAPVVVPCDPGVLGLSFRGCGWSCTGMGQAVVPGCMFIWPWCFAGRAWVASSLAGGTWKT